MADRFDQMLEPGEREVQRWRGAWLPDAWPLLAVVFLPLLAFPVVWLVSDGPEAVSLVYVASLVPGALFVAFMAAQSRATRIHLTDRRLICSAGLWAAKITSLPLEEITAFDWFPGPAHGTVKVEAAGNRVLLMPMRRSNEDLPAALAEATGLPIPPLIGPGRFAVVSLILLSAWVAGFAMIFVSIAVLPWTEIKPLLEDFEWAATPALLLGMAVVMLTASALGTGFALFLARFLLSAEDFRMWLAAEPAPNWVRPLPEIAVPAALRFGGLLYGQPMHRSGLKMEAVPPSAALDAGEPVVFRARRRWIPWGTRQFEHILVSNWLMASFLYLTSAMTQGGPGGFQFDLDRTLAFPLIFALGMPLYLWTVLYQPGSLVLTDRRLRYRSGRRAKVEHQEIALRDVARVRVLLSGDLEIQRRDGEPVVAFGLPHGRRIAAAIARATGVPPELPPRWARVAERLWIPLAELIALTGLAVVFYFVFSQSSSVVGLVGIVILLPFCFMAMPVLTLFGMAALARTFATPETLSAWLDREDSIAGRLVAWIRPRLPAFAQWLTGRPGNADETEVRHG